MRRVFVLINNTGIGGTERRFGRLFGRMANNDPDTTLVINALLWKQLIAAGVISGKEKRVWRLPEPCRSLAERIGLSHQQAGFWVRKLDYVVFAVICFIRYVPVRARLFHVVLGGVYIVLPLMLLRLSHRIAMSVVSADLSLQVGRSWAVPIYSFSLKRAQIIDVLTDTARADLIQRGIAADKILVSPGSVLDLERFQPATAKQPWVVFAGRLIEEKNPLLFLEAIPRIHQAVPQARFFLLGQGELGPRVEQAVDRLHLRALLQTGFQPDLAPILARASVFVSIQRTDNYPSQSLLEAMACGVATVATDVGLTWRLIDATTGIRVKPEPSEIADAVIELLQDPLRCASLGASARSRVSEEHSEDGYLRHLDGLYERLEAT